jgi:hypothetical protein
MALRHWCPKPSQWHLATKRGRLPFQGKTKHLVDGGGYSQGTVGGHCARKDYRLGPNGLEAPRSHAQCGFSYSSVLRDRRHYYLPLAPATACKALEPPTGVIPTRGDPGILPGANPKFAPGLPLVTWGSGVFRFQIRVERSGRGSPMGIHKFLMVTERGS